MTSCSESQKTVNIALTLSGKTYLYSIMNKIVVEQQLQNGEMPTMMNSTVIVEDGKQLFMDAHKIKTISNVLGGNIELLEKQETSFDGYFVEGSSSVFTQQLRNKDSGEIGKIAGIVEATLTHPKNGSVYTISWQISPELKPIKNCSLQSLTVKYSQNSNNEFTSKDFVMVDLNDINTFFGSLYKLRYDENAALLHVEKKLGVTSSGH